MKLREQFLKHLQDNAKIFVKSNGVELQRFYESDADSCEKIADDYAIGFAEWLEINKEEINYSQNHNIKELLTIFKQTL